MCVSLVYRCCFQTVSVFLIQVTPGSLPGLAKCTYTKVHVLIKSTPSYIVLFQEAPQLVTMWVMVGVGDRLPSRCCRCGGATSTWFVFYKPLSSFQSIIVSDPHNSPDLLGRTLRLQGISLVQHLKTNHHQALDKPVC